MSHPTPKHQTELVISNKQEEQLRNLITILVRQSDNNRTDENSLDFAMGEHGFHGDILSDVSFLAKYFQIGENNPSHWKKREAEFNLAQEAYDNQCNNY